MSRLRFYSHLIALRTARDLYVMSYIGLARGFGWLDKRQLRRR